MRNRPALSPMMPLAPTHVVGACTCGDTEIDDFLRNRARVEQATRLSRVYVTLNDAQEVVASFTLSPITIRIEGGLLSKLGIGAAPYPVIGGFLLGRLGVHTALQKQGLGETLVIRAAQTAKREAGVVGGAFVAVDPKTDDLVRWYAKLDFIRLSERLRRIIVPLSAVP